MRAVMERLGDVLENTDGVTVEQVRIGQRTIPADGRTDFAGDRYYVVATHSGITLAPLLADLVAGEVLGAESPMLAPFRPDRFTTSATFGTLSPARVPGEQCAATHPQWSASHERS